MRRTRERKSSVFVRYALSYTLAVLLLFTGITAVLFRETGRQVLNGVIDTQINRMTRIAIQHEGYISTMLSTAEEIGLSPAIEPFRYDEEPWKAYELQKQMMPYTSTNAFCDAVYLHFAGDDRLYSSASSMTMEQFFSLTTYETTPKEKLEELMRGADRLTVLPAQRVFSDLIDGSSPRMVSFILPLGSSPGMSKGTLLFLVKETAYRNMFADAIDTSLNTYIFAEDEMIAGTEDLPLPADEARKLSPDGGYSRIFRWNGEDWMTVSLSGRSWGLQYTAAIRMADVSSAVYSAAGRVLMIMLLLTALSLGMILWMSRRHAKPIEAISSLLPAQEEEKKDELTRISSGIRQLTSRLDQALPMQRHDFIFRFIKGRFAGREEALATARNVRLDIDRKYFAAILCSVQEERDRPLELNRNPFRSLEGVTAAGTELVAMKANLYLAFSDRKEDLPALAEMIRREESVNGSSCVTAVSEPHTSFEEAPAAYLEAAAAYDNRFIRGERKLLTYADISSNVEDILPRAQKITAGISQALSLNNRDLLNERISELLQFLKNTNMSPFAFRMIYNDVIDTLTRGQAARLTSGKDAREFYDIFSLSSCQSIDDLDELLRRLCDSLMSGEIGAPPAPDEEDEMQQAARYMEEHCSDPELSMAAIAESLELSTARLSIAFKNRMGLTPSDYLALLRCERAKELLETTDLTIREISSRVGYYDAGSFIRRFKQITGETPLQYRKNRTGGPDGEGEKA